MGLKKPGKREIAYTWAANDIENENGPLQAQSNANKESKGLMTSP